MIRIGHSPRVYIEHLREDKPSVVTLWAILDGKREDTLRIDMTENALYELSEEALKVAAIMRRQRIEREEKTK